MFPRGDDNYGTVNINFIFNYFGKACTQLTIFTNGYVRFVASTSVNYFISGLNQDLITTTSGGIYYDNLNSQYSDYNSIKSDLNLLNYNFMPTNIFRITYDNVPKLNAAANKASFQIILASNATKSFVILKYTSCLNGIGLSQTPGLYYLSNGQQKSSTITIPCSNSNVNLGGTWVFDVS